MPFVNEYVNEADIQSNKLDELLSAEPDNKIAWKGGRPAVFKHLWTIDRERAIFLVRLSRVVSYDTPSGIPMPTSEEVCLLNINGHNVRFHLTRLEESSKSRSEVPYRLVWRISHLAVPESLETTRDEVEKIIQEAIAVRGVHGAISQIPNTVTSFKS